MDGVRAVATHPPLMQAHLLGITIDCVDPARLAEFWSALLGGRVREDADLPGWRKILVAEPRIVLSLQPVAEPKVGKVRIHVDVRVQDVATGVAEVERLGGSFTGERHDYEAGSVLAMTDPEGNEFCLVRF